jgi:hypothetical protein
MSLFFVLPPVCSAAGISFPSAGDPDLFLMPAGVLVFGGFASPWRGMAGRRSLRRDEGSMALLIATTKEVAPTQLMPA